MKSIEAHTERGFHLSHLMESFPDPFRTELWERIRDTPQWRMLQTPHVRRVSLDGRWFRLIAGHTAVDLDWISQFRRYYPPLLDRDTVWIES